MTFGVSDLSRLRGLHSDPLVELSTPFRRLKCDLGPIIEIFYLCILL